VIPVERHITKIGFSRFTSLGDTATSETLNKHFRAKGFLSNPYHFVVTRQGFIQTGRRLAEPSAVHTLHDANLVAVAVIGSAYTDEQVQATNILKKQFSNTEVVVLGQK
jgi:hypothetical protein